MKSVYVVYKYEENLTHNGIKNLLGDYDLIEWKPSMFSIVPTNIAFEKKGYIKNWIYHIPRLLSHSKNTYLVYALAKESEVLCQCIVTPASIRYSFMKRHDLQFGLVFTSPRHRNKKLANLMVNSIINKNRKKARSFWWITEIDNIPSRRVAEHVGFRLISKAKRKSLISFSYYKLIGTE
ncbi:MAG: GNAT family N-acetyltransferase [Candidatus Aminicenantales bacterium]|jgi:RimJ/RimL family protein N-acetyltransferase